MSSIPGPGAAVIQVVGDFKIFDEQVASRRNLGTASIGITGTMSAPTPGAIAPTPGVMPGPGTFGSGGTYTPNFTFGSGAFAGAGAFNSNNSFTSTANISSTVNNLQQTLNQLVATISSTTNRIRNTTHNIDNSIDNSSTDNSIDNSTIVNNYGRRGGMPGGGAMSFGGRFASLGRLGRIFGGGYIAMDAINEIEQNAQYEKQLRQAQYQGRTPLDIAEIQLEQRNRGGWAGLPVVGGFGSFLREKIGLGLPSGDDFERFATTRNPVDAFRNLWGASRRAGGPSTEDIENELGSARRRDAMFQASFAREALDRAAGTRSRTLDAGAVRLSGSTDSLSRTLGGLNDSYNEWNESAWHELEDLGRQTNAEQDPTKNAILHQDYNALKNRQEMERKSQYNALKANSAEAVRINSIQASAISRRVGGRLVEGFGLSGLAENADFESGLDNADAIADHAGGEVPAAQRRLDSAERFARQAQISLSIANRNSQTLQTSTLLSRDPLRAALIGNGRELINGLLGARSFDDAGSIIRSGLANENLILQNDARAKRDLAFRIHSDSARLDILGDTSLDPATREARAKGHDIATQAELQVRKILDSMGTGGIPYASGILANARKQVRAAQVEKLDSISAEEFDPTRQASSGPGTENLGETLKGMASDLTALVAKFSAMGDNINRFLQS
ncbi:MAG TPA: hypothetical protein VFE47_17470 [Tepidisphaeraceae bacterium]|jgi:hypothetical protein|nr:hypothetical protein [Tepidisphaeraceae bacterium]